MIRFLIKGLLRDKNRSLLPLLVVAIGVMLTVFFHAYLNGVIGESIDFNAKFSTGHVKIMSRAYAENSSQLPVDLALTGTDELEAKLKQLYPDITWVTRIRFGGLIDVPDKNGETREQGPAFGLGIDLLSPNTQEPERLKLKSSLVRGSLPSKPGEVILSEEFSKKLNVNPGDTITLISTTMYGSMSIYNFVVAGTINFGTNYLDKGAIVADLADVRQALNMEDAAGEILGYLPGGYYNDEKAHEIKKEFNSRFSDPDDAFSPVMETLRDQDSMDVLLDYISKFTFIILFVFILAMSIVLWNAGLLAGIRRYGEVGLRLAMGEEKGHIYRSMIMESVLIGIGGTIVGTLVGLAFGWYLQTYGLNLGNIMQNAGMMMPSTFHARISSVDWYIGFIPGLFSTVLGTMLSGIGIYKRQTARLFRELEL
jgi:putative ABC transport system permease protein